MMSKRRSFYSDDAVNDDYKVLGIFPDDCELAGSEVVVYSLKNKSWRRLQNISNHFHLVNFYGMFLAGALHWMTIKTLGSESYQSILAYDLAAENYREVPMSRVQIDNIHEWSLCIFAESLCVLTFHHPCICIDVWLMNDYMVGNSWRKVFSLEHPEIVRSYMSVGPVAYSKSRKDVLIGVVMKKLIWYNLETNEIKAVKIANMSNLFHGLNVYTESLVAPDYFPSSDEKPS